MRGNKSNIKFPFSISHERMIKYDMKKRSNAVKISFIFSLAPFYILVFYMFIYLLKVKIKREKKFKLM